MIETELASLRSLQISAPFRSGRRTVHRRRGRELFTRAELRNLRAITWALQRGQTVTVFPEGTTFAGDHLANLTGRRRVPVGVAIGDRSSPCARARSRSPR